MYLTTLLQHNEEPLCKYVVVTVLFDFSKAFDIINHRILLRKSEYGSVVHLM